MKWKTVIIDDEPLAVSVIEDYLKAHADIEVAGISHNGFEGLKSVMQHQPDLLFLDIQMPKINGFEMLELIDEPPDVIFTTAFDEFAIRAFEMHAVDYLLKPFSKERFDKTLEKWKSLKKQNDKPKNIDELLETASRNTEEVQRLVVKSGSQIQIIPVYEIHYMEAYDDYVKIYTGKDCHLKKETMQRLESVLDASQFVRVHRSYIVHIRQITRIEPMGKDSHIAVLIGGVKIPLSKTGYVKLKDVLGI